MRVSLNWLKTYLAIDLPPEKVGEILTDIGLEVEGMETVESIPGGLEGVVVGHVLECGRHPNADRLSVTRVDVGDGEPLHVVCGAPNVAAGQKVMVATVGATLHPVGSEEPLTIKKGKIRGEVSEGMICAEDELGLGESHDGIMVLPEDSEVGQPARDYFQLETDIVYEIGLTPNRSDATNHVGVARDLAAALKINYDHPGELQLPSVEGFKVDNHHRPVEVVVEDPAACPRYAGLTIEGITVGESPDWLKRRLQAVGVRPLNNIVDATNYVLHELGQPLHAFDLAEVKGQKIIVRTLPQNTKFQSLDEMERTLTDDDLMICDGDSNGMCIAGVFGGLRSGVKATTHSIFLESAHFSPKYVRRTSMHHNLRTDAAKVFEKGSDPNVTVYALKRAALLIQELAGGEVASELIDLYPEPVQPLPVAVNYARVNRLIGVEIPRETIHAILAAMDMPVLDDDGENFTVAVTTNKTDVTREADVIEEILRIYGFNKVPIPDKIKTAMAIAPQPDPTELRRQIGALLTGAGFHEMMALSLSQSKYYEGGATGLPREALVFVNNTANVHLDIMRPDMLFSGLEAVLHNQNRQQNDLKLFEFGRTYRKTEKGYAETEHLSLFLTGRRWPENWITGDERPVDYYTLKAFVGQVLGRLGLDGYQETSFQDDTFLYGMRYHRGPRILAEFGQVSGKLTRALDIRGAVYFADLHWGPLVQATGKHSVQYAEVSKYPGTRRDLALVVEKSVKFTDIVSIARKAGKNLLKEVNLFDVYENKEQLGAGKKSYAVSLFFEDPNKTLKDKEVDKVMDKLIAQSEAQLGAVIRR